MRCLGDATVLRFISGASNADERARVEHEIAHCARCAAVVAAAATEIDRYVISEPAIARGGMGTIFAARDRKLGRDVALKRLDVASPVAAARFEHEIEITASLQHPNIVPIYDAGELPDGRRFYAMRHVPGRSLEEVIAAAASPEARLALVPSVIAAADAVAYAHERGVVHRDLKPLNVLVGAFGETVVIDWGLAKIADDSTPSASIDDGLERALAGETRDGTIVGTPRYMSPEQARGEPATSATDVYALGAILYQALTGSPPNDSTRASEALARVASGAIVPLGQAAPNLPRDLVAIVERAMAPTPHARYPTAGAFADDLRRFQTGQLVSAYRYSMRARLRRFVRRHRVALSVALAFTLLTVALGVLSIARIVSERDAAHRASAHADLQRAGAEELVEFMLSDLRVTLSQVGRLDALAGVGDRVERYLWRMDRGAPSASGSRVRARVLELRAALTATAGDFVQAEAQLEQASALLDRSDAIDPRSTVARRLRATLAFHRGIIASRTGKPAIAIERFGESVAALRAMRAEDLTDTVDLLLAASLTNLANVLDRSGQSEEASRAFREVDELLRERLRDHPADAEAVVRLASMHVALGQSHQRRGDIQAAEQAFRAGLAIVEPQREGNARSDLVLDGTMLMLVQSLATLRREAGDHAESAKLHQRAYELAERAVAIEPRSQQWQLELARTRRELGTDAIETGDLALAVDHLSRASTDLEMLYAASPADRMVGRWTAITTAELAEAHRRLGHVPAARAAYRKAAAVFEQLASGGDADAKLDFATALRDEAAFERKAGTLARAAELVEQAVSIIRALPAADARPQYELRRAVTLVEAARIAAKRSDVRAVRVLSRDATAIINGLRRRGQFQPSWTAELELPSAR